MISFVAAWQLLSGFDLPRFSSFPLICTNDLAEIRYQFYNRSLLFSDSQVGERPPAKLLTTKWLWTGGLRGSLSTHTITLTPLFCYLLFPIHVISIIYLCTLDLALCPFFSPFFLFCTLPSASLYCYFLLLFLFLSFLSSHLPTLP